MKKKENKIDLLSRSLEGIGKVGAETYSKEDPKD